MKRIAAKKMMNMLAIFMALTLLLMSCNNDLNYIEVEFDPALGSGETISLLGKSYVNSFSYVESSDKTTGIKQSILYTNNNFQVFGNEIYIKNNYCIYRYIPQTGTITSVCADPLCRHGTMTCPFAGLNAIFPFYVSNDIVYY